LFLFRPSSRKALTWALEVRATGRNDRGELVFQDGTKFLEAFGKPSGLMVKSARGGTFRAPDFAPGQGYQPGSSLGATPSPLFQTNVPGGQQWLYDCADGTLGIMVETAGSSYVVHSFVHHN
jgi:hypothetical protein